MSYSQLLLYGCICVLLVGCKDSGHDGDSSTSAPAFRFIFREGTPIGGYFTATVDNGHVVVVATKMEKDVATGINNQNWYETDFQLSDKDVRKLYNAITNSGFLELENEYDEPGTKDGAVYRLRFLKEEKVLKDVRLNNKIPPASKKVIEFFGKNVAEEAKRHPSKKMDDARVREVRAGF